MSRYVVSLGGNALGNDATSQKALVKQVAEPIVSLIEEGHEVVIVHGNGPQVGMINLAFTESASTPDMPFAECGAMSQGYIGFHIQNAIQNRLAEKQNGKAIAALVTQVLVDANDPGFDNPTKPVGAFYSEKEAQKLREEKGYIMQEDSGRGYRRVVASPYPIDIIEKPMITSLLNDGHVVICSGGGGIPVIRKDNHLEGIAAVIDKDYASAKVAELIDADMLVILTAVDHVYVDFGKPNQRALKDVHLNIIEPMLEANVFGAGSMQPKVKACVDFVRKSGNTAVISSLDKAVDAFRKKVGTIITP